MKIKKDIHWDRYYDWMIIPTIIIASRYSHNEGYVHGIGFAFLWLKFKAGIILLTYKNQKS